MTTTHTLKQALILVEHDGLAAAILDHALDDGDSTLLCQRLKERDVPFVIYSGFAEVDGVCAQGPLISKPASVEALIIAVEGLLTLSLTKAESAGPSPGRSTCITPPSQSCEVRPASVAPRNACSRPLQRGHVAQRVRGGFGGKSYSSSVVPPHLSCRRLASLRARFEAR